MSELEKKLTEHIAKNEQKQSAILEGLTGLRESVVDHLARSEENDKYIKQELGVIKAEVKHTNGRVTRLEKCSVMQEEFAPIKEKVNRVWWSVATGALLITTLWAVVQFGFKVWNSSNTVRAEELGLTEQQYSHLIVELEALGIEIE